MVRRIRWGRMLLVIFLMAFAVFFGLDLATRGMERVQGPAADAGKPAAVAHQPETKAAAGAKAGTTTAAGGSAGGTKGTAASSSASTTTSAATSASGTSAAGTKSAATAKTSVSGTTAKAAASGQGAASSNEPKFEMKKSFMNQLSNRVGDALRRAARAIIGLVVTVFGSLIE
jgi:hypothetical protein